MLCSVGIWTRGHRMVVTVESNGLWHSHPQELQSFFKKWAYPGLFCLFSFFSNTILQKNCRLQRDSNSDLQSRRRARWPLDHHYGPRITNFNILFKHKTCSCTKSRLFLSKRNHLVAQMRVNRAPSQADCFDQKDTNSRPAFSHTLVTPSSVHKPPRHTPPHPLDSEML